METERLEWVDASLVITLDEIKAQLIVEHDDDDVLITRHLVAAMEFAENRLSRSIRLRRHKTYGCHWLRTFELPHGPVRLIESVSYIDNDGVSREVDSTTYQVVKKNGVDRLHFLTVPSNGGTGRIDSVSVTYVAGYGVLADSLTNSYSFSYELPVVLGYTGGSTSDVNDRAPDNIRQAVYMLCGHWYENRESVVVGTGNSPVALAAESLLLQSRVLGL